MAAHGNGIAHARRLEGVLEIERAEQQPEEELEVILEEEDTGVEQRPEEELEVILADEAPEMILEEELEVILADEAPEVNLAEERLEANLAEERLEVNLAAEGPQQLLATLPWTLLSHRDFRAPWST